MLLAGMRTLRLGFAWRLSIARLAQPLITQTQHPDVDPQITNHDRTYDTNEVFPSCNGTLFGLPTGGYIL